METLMIASNGWSVLTVVYAQFGNTTITLEGK